MFMDLWALFLKSVFSIPSPNYCLVGRWLSHMPEGTFMHASIAAASPKRSECTVGWIAHYVIGTVYAFVLIAFVSNSWLVRPSLFPAMLFGIGSVGRAVPGHAAIFRARHCCNRERRIQRRPGLRSLMAHAVFGVGLYTCAVGVSHVLRTHA
jgi:hypothetical protein